MTINSITMAMYVGRSTDMTIGRAVLLVSGEQMCAAKICCCDRCAVLTHVTRGIGRSGDNAIAHLM